MNTQELRNPQTVFLIDPDGIFGRDLIDRNNEPATMNRSKRGLVKAWAALVAAWTEELTMYEAQRILTDHGIRMHSWCMMD